ncbi:hypothetical protein LRD18_10345 [Halorhodospira halochloris]|nr:hypothetical protein [Halorhodospira halochloris]MCG5531258.1 hypothetical protein [Halorhodospira halochloris]MCG5547753.1 hypothetical protein [Halorhodospira halochloris]
MNSEEFDEKFDADEEDVVEDLDFSTARRVNLEQKRINPDYAAPPLNLAN